MIAAGPRSGLTAGLLLAGLLVPGGSVQAGAPALGAAQPAGEGFAAGLAALLASPLIAVLLIALGLLLLAADALFGGIGWLSVAGLTLLAIFFWAHAQLGLAGWEGAALTLLGLVLLAVEALVIPGFGVAGLLGLAALLGGVFLAITGGVVTPDELMRAGWMLLAIVTLLVAGLSLLARALPQSRRLRGLVLSTKVGAPDESRPPGRVLRWLGGSRLELLNQPRAPDTERLSLVGASGRAVSALRPAGVAEITGRQYEVRTEGEYVGAGEPVEVIRDDGARLVVRRADVGERL
jgi:membrane-bound serine protease (ClpP class)